RRAGKTLLFVAPGEETAENVTNDLRAILGQGESDGPEILFYPTPDRSRGDRSLESASGGDSAATQGRLATLDALHRAECGEGAPIIVVATINALSHLTIPPTELRSGYDEIVVGQTLNRDAFIEHLSQTGYERVEQVEAPGQFAARGGLVDFYPPSQPQALRLELFGDEIDSLRFFDVDTQRSTEKIKQVRLTPPREVYLTRECGREVAHELEGKLALAVKRLDIEGREREAEALREAIERDIMRLEDGVYFPGLERYAALFYPQHPTLIEHLPPDALVVWADPGRAQGHLERIFEDAIVANDAEADNGEGLKVPPPLCSFGELRERASKYFGVDLLIGAATETQETLDIHLPPSFGGKLDQFLDYIGGHQRRNGLVIVSTAHARRVREILADGNLHHVHLLDAVSEATPGSVLLMPQRLTTGFSIDNVLVVTDGEIFGWQASPHRLLNKRGGRKREAKRSFGDKATALSDLADLREGDYVVHINHGIARYAGTTRREVAGAVNDYLLLEYEGQDRLYVPVGQLDRVQKYLGSDAVAPPLNALRGNAWERTKKRVREETQQTARQLAELYAAREQAEKEPLPPDTPWQREMESAFPFEETPSQLQAIKDSKSDLESPKPMDRLVCGDVGYGKTEVAVRAAFKVAQENRQVAVLVPTTVLAQQHYQTFAERLAPYPVRVDVLSRFRTPGEQRKVIEDVRLGAIDILVGTHRLLQADMQWHNLGLVIVDEEQRFGVAQKEKLKELRKEVDILTLSATPIPRTLQFALGGMREISLINDPPRGRLPVKTYVMPYKDEVVRQAIERELEREGQVYYVHNRISSIAHIAERIHKLIPRVRIGIGHGQMGDEELEQVMLDFMHHRTDVLLATTIIENGLDLPNVNTLIVDRAELLGLSQMYQLRGRVGRSSRQAYAYFFSGSRGKLSEVSENRFAAIQEHTDLGAGFKIAMRDLEIRGAGDVLGTKQSGSISSVGFEMYTDLLQEAVKKLRHVPVVRREELPEADLPVPAFLPNEYVEQERDRLGLYRKMSNIRTEEDIKSLQDELRDRFGPLPAPAFNLIRVLKIRLYLLHARLRGISKSESEVLIRLKPGDRFADEDTTALYARLNKSTDKRALQHIALRPIDGIAIDSRVLSTAQLLRMIEEITETLAQVRGPRLLGETSAKRTADARR
ncbi:MAG: hypothetical protein JWN98_2415, partial [Abditibacteriota bacterium]|nr:hypothetical protein [Abditibacteriota bacterium]